MKQFCRNYYKYLFILFSALFVCTVIKAQVVTPKDETFISYSAANPIFSRDISLTPTGGTRPLVFSFAGTPGVSTAAGIMYLGERPAGTTIFKPSNVGLFFNYTTGGVIPGASSGTGQGDYRIHFSSASDTSVKAGNFKLKSIYLAIGSAAAATTITIQGFRAGRQVAAGEITGLVNGASYNVDGGGTGLTYIETAGTNVNGNVTIQFGSDWSFLDGIRIIMPKDIPLHIDDIIFDQAGADQIAPSSQAGTLTSLNVTGITTSLTWSKTGDADYSAVFVKAVATTGTVPVTNLQTYTPNTAFGAGGQVGSSGWYCIYNGTGNSTSISSLTPGTAYRAMVLTLNGNTGSEQYVTTETTNTRNFTTIAAPTAQAGNIVFTATGPTSTMISWTNGNGTARAVFAKLTSTGTIAPTFNTSYIASTTLTAGSQISSTGWYCVYNGTGNSVTVTNLSAGQIYTARVFEYRDNGIGGGQTFLTAAGTNNPLSVTTDAAPVVSTSAASSVAASAATLNGNIDDKGASTGVRFIYATNPGLAPSTTITGSPATVTGDTGPTAVTGSLTGLNPSTIYYYRVRGINVVGTANGAVLSFTTAPAVQLVNSTLANGSYKAGDLIPIRVVYTGPVTVTGAPTLALSTGGTATYASGSGSNNIIFNYTVLAGHNSTDLNYASASALALNGGTIQDENGINASISLPPPAAIGSLAGQKDLVIDTDAPTVSPVAIASNNAITTLAKTGDIVTLSFTSNETIVTPTVTIAGHAVSATNTSGNDWKVDYTMVSGDASGVIAFSIPFNDMVGNAGTTITATTNSSNVTFDKTAPALTPVTIISNNANTALAKVGDMVTLSFTSNETVNTPTVTIAGHTVTAVNTGANNWKADYTMVSGDAAGVIGFNISFTDLPGNNGTDITATTNSSSVTFDKTAPTLSTVSIASNNTNTALVKTGETVTLSFTSNETISTPTVTIAGHTVTATNGTGNNWTATYTMIAGDATGTVSFNISFKDLAGNAGTAVSTTTNSSSVVYDKTPPVLSTVSIASDHTNTAYAKVGHVITLSFTSNEMISTPVVTIHGNAAAVSNSGGNSWTAAYTMASGDATGTISFNISFADITGNNGTAVTATTNSSSVIFDNTTPTLSSVSITSNNANIALAKTGETVTLNFTSDETIVTPVIMIAGYGVTAANTGGNNWTAAYTMVNADATGTIAFNIIFSDLAGNTGTAVSATTNSSNVLYDKTNPSLSSVSIASGNANTAYAKTGDVITVSFTSNETIVTPTATILGHTATIANTGGNNWTAVYTTVAGDASGNIPFAISFNDVTGNAGATVTATTNSSNVLFDNIPPSLTAVSIVSDNGNTALAKTGNNVTVSFTSNETITTPTVTIAGHTATVSNTGGNNWKAVYTMISADASGNIPFSISFSDLAGNAGSTVTATTNNSNVVYDKAGPSLTAVSIVSNNADPLFAKTGDIIKLNFTSAEAILMPFVTIAGQTATITTTGNNNWMANYTMTGNDAAGTVPFSISCTDLADNISITVTATTNSSAVTFDKTAPSVSSIVRQSPSAVMINATTVTYRVNFSEAVKGITPAAFQLTTTGATTGTIASVSSAAGTTVDVTVNAIAGNGTLRLDLKNAATGITDAAGNAPGGFISGDIYTINQGILSFPEGSSQTLTLCIDNNTPTSLNNRLRVAGGANGQTLTWTIITNPVHGTINGFPATATISAMETIPTGLSYLAANGYTGTDAFTIQVSDGVATATASVNITVNALPIVSITAAQGTILCGTGATLPIAASGGATYSWYNNGSLIQNTTGAQLTVNATGSYTAKATDAAGCTGVEGTAITITQLQKPTVAFNYASYCIGKSITFTDQSVTANSGQVSYLWNDGNNNTSTNTSPAFTFNQQAGYNVKLKITPAACPSLADSLTRIVTIDVPVAAIRMPFINVAANYYTPLQARTFGTAYQWSPATGLSSPGNAATTVSVTNEQQYTVAISVASGCVTVDTILVKVFAGNTILVPNIFSPNNDGQNDKLFVNLVGIKTLQYFRVFNRYGKKMFETANLAEGWDGKLNGVPQPVDTYIWTADGISSDGFRIYREGTFTLAR